MSNRTYSISPSTILSLVKKQSQVQIAFRRKLHQQPELSTQEYKTTALLKKEIQKLNLNILPTSMPTGLLVEIVGDSPGRTIAIRTDIDALPIVEQTGLPFASRNTGSMHACGHDMHMATIMGAVKILTKLRKDIQGSIRIIFQPAEEQPPGGARPMIADGALDDVDAILGLHVDPRVPTGKIGLRDGVTMASVTDFDLIIHGVGGHAARPQTAVDAIVIASEIVSSIQTIVSRQVDPIGSVAITFGMIQGGTARNVIADSVKLTGTARALSPADQKRLPKLIRRVAEKICQAHGARLEMNIIAGYPVLSNSISINKLFAQTYESLFGKGKIVETEPVLGGEDFACYLEHVPGAMVRIGVKNKKIGADKSWHHPQFIADEASLHYATALIVSSVVNFLNE